MCQVIRGVRDRGVTILMIEHVMRAIMSLSDRIIVTGEHLVEQQEVRATAQRPGKLETLLARSRELAR